MKKIYFFILIMIFFVVKAQNISYEKLDSISADISRYQLKSENLIYNIGENKYELGFPENNFQIFYSTNTATRVFNKKKGDKEFVFIAENIDLSKVEKIVQATSYGDLGIIRMNFPKDFDIQIYTNGVYTLTIQQNYLEFFYNRNEEGSRNRLLTQLDKTFSLLNLGNKISKDEFLAEEKIKSDKPEETSAKILTVDDIVEKYVKTLGGEEKVRSIRTLTIEGTIETQGMKIPVRSWMLHNQAMRMDMEIQGKANTTVVTNNSAWTLFPIQNQRKPVNADFVVAKEGMEELDLTGDLFDHKTKGNIVELIGKESIDGNDLYKIKLVRKSGTVVMLFIDADTFFLTKRIMNKNMQGRTVEVTETIGDYRINDDGFVYASFYQYSPAGTSVNYNSFQVNKNIDPKLFEKP